jgi:hypothetical protein
MLYDTVNSTNTFDNGDKILFSIMPIRSKCRWNNYPDNAAMDIDGGEIFYWQKGQNFAQFLNHGLHPWDTAFSVAQKFKTGSENINPWRRSLMTKQFPNPLQSSAY